MAVTISTHTSRVGCDIKDEYTAYCFNDFYSHIPCGMWHKRQFPKNEWFIFLLTHPVWDVTVSVSVYTATTLISTHTSRVGCDYPYHSISMTSSISTHTSRVGCDNVAEWSGSAEAWFLLTHPVWDVTLTPKRHSLILEFLLTHPVWDVTAIYSIFQSHYSHILQDGPIIHLELY